MLFCFVRQRCFGFTLLPCSGVSPVFAGIAVSILEGSAPEYAPLIQGTIAAAADARQPGPGKPSGTQGKSQEGIRFRVPFLI